MLDSNGAENLVRDESADLIYIIVPTRFSEGIADSYLFDSCEVQLLKVPESIMAALADPKGPFTNNKMPDRGRLVDSIAFDLIIPPMAKCDWKLKGEDVICGISSFETYAVTKKPLDKKKSGLKSLAFVAVDPLFDGDIFRPQYTWESKSLKEHKYRLSFPAVDNKAKVLISFTDIFGNEKRELVELSRLQSGNG